MEVKGVSVSGLATRLHVPELKLVFDIGEVSPEVAPECSTVCITHGHMDHAGAAARLASLRAMGGQTPPHFVVPDHTAEAFMGMFKAFEDLDRAPLPHTLTVIHPHHRLPLGRDLSVEVFGTAHRIPCSAYGVWRETRKLKAEFVGMSGVEIAGLKQRGVAITDVTSTLVFAYTGDTTMDLFDTFPVLYTAQTLAMELTFFQDYLETKARHWGHTHVQNVIDRADLFQNQEVVLVHQSARYGAEQKHGALMSLPTPLRDRARWLEVSL